LLQFYKLWLDYRWHFFETILSSSGQRQIMDYRELLEKYNHLLSENRRLMNENDRLKAQLGIAERKHAESRIAGPTIEKSIQDDEPTNSDSFSGVNNSSDSISKIRLFMSLFKGRDDVYAKK
jgi:cell shape-determining protein MreC